MRPRKRSAWGEPRWAMEEVGGKREKQGAEYVEEEVGADGHGREEETRADRHLWGKTGELQKNGWKGGNEPS